MSQLTAKQEQFCLEYVVDLNATQAAIRAGYSKKTAGSVGNENLTKPEIARRVDELQTRRSNMLSIAAEDVVKGLHSIAKDYDAPHAARVSAWNSIGKHLGMFTDKVEHSGEVGIRRIERVILND